MLGDPYMQWLGSLSHIVSGIGHIGEGIQLGSFGKFVGYEALVLDNIVWILCFLQSCSCGLVFTCFALLGPLFEPGIVWQLFCREGEKYLCIAMIHHWMLRCSSSGVEFLNEIYKLSSVLNE